MTITAERYVDLVDRLAAEVRKRVPADVTCLAINGLHVEKHSRYWAGVDGLEPA